MRSRYLIPIIVTVTLGFGVAVLGGIRLITLAVVLRPGEDGWIVAECPTIPGCISQGRTRDEALANIREAIELCLESGDGPRGEFVEITVAA